MNATGQSSLKQNNKAITQDVTPGDNQPAHLVVEGPTEVECGNLVVISVEKSNASSFKWLVVPSADNYLVIEGGKRIIFSSGTCGTYTFIVACSLGDTCDLAVHTLVVTKKDTEKPVVNSLHSQIASWCKQIDTSAKRDECLALAQSFASVASVMEKGNLNTPTQLIEATSISNKAALGKSLEDWSPFRDGLAEKLKEMSEGGNLPDTASHVKMWKIIANALREYASTL
jgi:hypothetical protein